MYNVLVIDEDGVNSRAFLKTVSSDFKVTCTDRADRAKSILDKGNYQILVLGGGTLRKGSIIEVARLVKSDRNYKNLIILCLDESIQVAERIKEMASRNNNTLAIDMLSVKDKKEKAEFIKTFLNK